MKHTPSPKAPPGLAKILDEIRVALQGPPHISQRVFHQRVVAELKYEAPAFTTMIQHLRYWDASFRKPTPLVLGVYYWIATGRRLRRNVLEDAYKFPEEGRLALACRPLKVTVLD